MTTETAMTTQPAQLPLSPMPARLFSCTPSRLATWLTCPRRYRMVYVDRPALPRGAPWAHNSVGAAVHNALAGWWRLPRPARTPAAAGELVTAGWLTDGFRDAAQAELWRQRSATMVSSYVAAHLDPDDEPAGVERTVGTRTARLALSGRIDRLDRRRASLGCDADPAGGAAADGDAADGDAAGGDTAAANAAAGNAAAGNAAAANAAAGGDELVVVDYKTGRRPPSDTDARASLALAIYAVAAGRTLRLPCRRVELHHLPTCEVLAHEHTDASLERHLTRAESVAVDAQAAEAAVSAGQAGGADLEALFPPQPGPLCAWCDHHRHCPEGQAAAALRRPWDGLDDG